MKYPLFPRLLSLLSFLSYVYAQNCTANCTDDTGLEADPYLRYRPEFARSLPVQILLTGVVITLVVVLLINLIFTAQSHWPLAQINYILQISGVVTLLISLMATLNVVFAETITESQEWPYMLRYTAVNVPPSGDDTAGWTIAQTASWLLMSALTSALIQITHIQFLTLLYPSRLEGRLIFSLLAPLAILSAIAQLIPIQSNAHLTSAADAVRNVCNATLSLLFTVSLLIWGLLVNRQQAWRTEGGTAAFGASALTLAVASTGLNFLYVPREEEYLWLPGLMWAVVLWQNFLGWWWWVGAGSGCGVSGWEAKDQMEARWRMEEKKERKRKERGERRRGTKVKAKRMWNGAPGAENMKTNGGEQEGDESSEVNSPRHPIASATRGRDHTPANSSSSSQPTRLYGALPAFVRECFAMLRQAHQTAAREQAADRVERILEMNEGTKRREHRVGWGLGSFAWRTGRPRNDPVDSKDEYELQSTQEEINEVQSHDRDPALRPGVENTPERRGSMWWWGPLRQWRLQDATLYS